MRVTAVHAISAVRCELSPPQNSMPTCKHTQQATGAAHAIDYVIVDFPLNTQNLTVSVWRFLVVEGTPGYHSSLRTQIDLPPRRACSVIYAVHVHRLTYMHPLALSSCHPQRTALLGLHALLLPATPDAFNCQVGAAHTTLACARVHSAARLPSPANMQLPTSHTHTHTLHTQKNTQALKRMANNLPGWVRQYEAMRTATAGAMYPLPAHLPKVLGLVVNKIPPVGYTHNNTQTHKHTYTPAVCARRAWRVQSTDCLPAS